MGCLKLSHTEENTLLKVSHRSDVVGLKGSAGPNRYGYQGQYAEEDTVTGFSSFDLRMYDPVIGRWLAVDPARQFYSPYNGMGNNPISMVDPDGRYSRPGAWWRSVFTGGSMFDTGTDAGWAVGFDNTDSGLGYEAFTDDSQWDAPKLDAKVTVGMQSGLKLGRLLDFELNALSFELYNAKDRSLQGHPWNVAEEVDWLQLRNIEAGAGFARVGKGWGYEYQARYEGWEGESPIMSNKELKYEEVTYWVQKEETELLSGNKTLGRELKFGFSAIIKMEFKLHAMTHNLN